MPPTVSAPVPFRSIASRLIQRIVALALLCMVVLGGVHASFEFHRGQANFDRAVRVVAENSLRLLSTALWDIETAAVQRQVDWLASLSEVGHVRVQAVTGQVFEAGERGYEQLAPSIALPILSLQEGGSKLGMLEIWANTGYFRWQTLARTFWVLGGYVLMTLLVCLVVAWVLRRELQQPLQQMARFAAELQPKDLSRPLVLSRPHRARVDEIDLMAQGFERLQQALQGHIDHLDLLVAERTRQLEDVLQEVQRLSMVDALTGCLNRRAMDERLPAEIERSQRYGRALSVVFADVDYFKRVNDELGHAAGDVVLHDMAQRYRQVLRAPIDWIARYGGEEFVIVLPECGLEDAVQFARRLGRVTQATPVEVAGQQLHLTASFGVARRMAGEGAAQLLARADAMLYRAKAEGRNCVRSDSQGGSPA